MHVFVKNASMKVIIEGIELKGDMQITLEELVTVATLTSGKVLASANTTKEKALTKKKATFLINNSKRSLFITFKDSFKCCSIYMKNTL